MLTRLTHAAIAFAVTAVLYQAYAATVVPLVEPPARIEEAVDPALLAEDVGDGERQFETYRPLLATYFAPDHWALAKPPKMFDNGQAMIVLDEYEQNEGGQLKTPRCAVIFFPHGRVGAAGAPRDAIVMEPAGGAVLQMEGKVGGASFGRMQYGQLLGEVVIRSDMQNAGPEDDLRIVTRDLYMNEDLISTPEPVDMRLGKHAGRGRALEIKFLPAQSSASRDAGALYGKFDSLEITKEVSVTLDPQSFGAKSGAAPMQGKPAAAPGGHQARLTDAPIHVDCDGPFNVEFGNYLATFTDNVRVQQVHPDGLLDELKAEKLTIYFDPQTAFEPASIAATGSAAKHVVLLTAPAHDAAVQCGKLMVELKPQRLTLEEPEDGGGVAASYHGADIKAPMIRYQLPAEGSGATVGTLAIRGGAGRLRAVVDPQHPGDIFEVTWKDALQIIRRDGQPVLVLDGRPTIAKVGLGTLYANSIELFLRERTPAELAADGGAKPSGLPASVVPRLLTASNSVNIDSAELKGRVNQLQVKFNYPKPVVAAAAPAPGGPPPANSPVTPASPTTPANPLASFAQNRGGLPAHQYDISGVDLKLGVGVHDGQAQLSSIQVDGGVVLKEQSQVLAAEPPMKITAEHLKITKADTPNTVIELRGAGGENGLPVQLVEIASRDALLRAPAVLVHRGTNRAWINSPGELQLMVAADLTGKPLAAPEPLAIVWQEAMELNGNQITFRGDVRAQHTVGWLHTNRLVAQLTTPVDFASGMSGGAKPQLAQLECWEGAVAEFDQRDAADAVVSHQHLELNSIRVNQITGLIAGDGPGKIDSVHLAKTSASLVGGGAFAGFNGDAAAEAAAPATVDGPPQLKNLHIEFANSVGGNLLQRHVEVLGDVKTVYGPVASWDDRLSMTLGGRPPEGVVWISCDKLGITESPLAQVQMAPAERRGSLGPVELDAEGRVIIELQHPEKGAFTLRGGKATYDQPKTMFVLAGDGVRPATIANQQYPGAQVSEQSAQKLIYWQATGEASIQGVNKIEWGNFNTGAKPGGVKR